jgi:hypothetical protein
MPLLVVQINCLTSGMRYYFRVQVASRKNQKSGVSDIASVVAA